MTCCGQRRAIAMTPGKAMASKQPRRPNSRSVLYQYNGATAMTVVGPLSGRRYRFDQPGAIVQVDSRDVPSMVGLPHLHRRNP